MGSTSQKQLCPVCAARSHERRQARTDLSGRRVLLIGGRAKIGMYIALRLLRDGAETTITTRSRGAPPAGSPRCPAAGTGCIVCASSASTCVIPPRDAAPGGVGAARRGRRPVGDGRRRDAALETKLAAIAEGQAAGVLDDAFEPIDVLVRLVHLSMGWSMAVEVHALEDVTDPDVVARRRAAAVLAAQRLFPPPKR